MKQAYFIFNNISSEDYLMVNKLPPIIKAQKNIQKIEIEGRDGFLTQDNGTYKGTIKPVECTIMDLDNLDFICSWLDGSADVIFSNEPERIYKATIISQIPFDKIAATFHNFLIQFECQPHKYAISDSIITLTIPETIYNGGSVNSKPVIKVYGTGSINLIINSNVINLTNVSGYVTINSDLMDCYKDTLLKNNDMNGEFPQLIVGNNTINWTGIVTKVEILPSWRYL